MAIKLVSINKISDKIYSVTVEDTANQIGVDENSSPIYRRYSARYNSNNSAATIIASLKTEMKERKVKEAAKSAVETKIKTAVEAIDITKV